MIIIIIIRTVLV